MRPEIRNDDVLQIAAATKHQLKCLEGRSFFDHFVGADEMFAEYNYPCILAVLAEGITFYPQWVEYIKKNKHRFKIELHGFNHINYRNLSKEELKSILGDSKKRIEDAFETEITTWYLPFGRKGENPYGEEVCQELGITYDKQTRKIDARLWLKHYQETKESLFPHMNFHYWYKPQVDYVNKILCLLNEKN